MFTGIIEGVGRIESIESGAEGGRLRVSFDTLDSSLNFNPLVASRDSKSLDSSLGASAPVDAGGAPLALGSSIAVNGCCLTVAGLDGEIFSADLSAETLRRTAFREMKRGARVNLERPLAAGKELGGHFVQGHVDGTGRVTALTAEGANWRLGVRVPAEVERYVAQKGSIAIDGISLTVADIRGGIVEAAIIPFTYANTNLQGLVVGDEVNLEADILAKYVEKLMEARRAPAAASGGLTVERLMEEGF